MAKKGKAPAGTAAATRDRVIASGASRSALFALGLVGASSGAYAAAVVSPPLTVSDPFLQYQNFSPNPLGFTLGEAIRYGAVGVTPNGAAGTTGIATTTNVATGGTITRNINFLPSPLTHDFFVGSLAICTTNCSPTGNNNPANLTGPWDITFSNPTTTPGSVSITTLHTPLPTSPSIPLNLVGGEIPFLNNVTLSGTSAAPNFSWTPPPGLAVDGYRINIYQNNLEVIDPVTKRILNSGQVASTNVAPTVTSYTVKSTDFTSGTSLSPNTTYTIEIKILQTRDGSTTNLSNSNVSSFSSLFSTFQVSTSPTPPINLPTVSGNNVYTFNLTVAPGISYSIDPSIATGYIYQTGAGDPNFASVELPNIGNSGPYGVYLWNGMSFVFDAALAANTVFDFAPGGVNEFEVLGIDPQLGLDPSNTTAFITTLTFEGAGRFTGTMTPVITDVGVPEPTTLVLLATGLLGCSVIRRRRIARPG